MRISFMNRTMEIVRKKDAHLDEMRDISDVNSDFISSICVLDDVKSVIEVFRSFGIDGENSVVSKISSNFRLSFAYCRSYKVSQSLCPLQKEEKEVD